MDGFDLASLSPEYRGAAYTELAKIYCKKKDYQKSISYCKEALVQNAHNIKALEIQSINERLLKNTNAAIHIWRQILVLDPLNHTVDFENYLVTPTNANLIKFKNNLHNEMPAENYFELASSYYELGLNSDAEKAVTVCDNNTLAKYWKAYFIFQQHKPFEKTLAEANEASPDFVFPARRLDLDILNWAVGNNNKSWKPKYYQALLLKSKNWKETDINFLFEHIAEQPDYAPFYATRAKLNETTNPEKAMKDLQKAISLDKEQWRYTKALTELFIKQKRFTEALQTIAPFYQAHPKQYIMGMLYAKSLLLNNQYAAADQLLTNLQIIPFEGATRGHELYHVAKLMQALEALEKNEKAKAITFIHQAKEWPENLGAGKPYDADINTSIEDRVLELSNQDPKDIANSIALLKETILKII
jgi:tetratricopeptide (TPR) repeat protein